MIDVNRIILLGRLGKDPIRKEIRDGLTVVNFSLATSRRVRAENDLEGVATGEETEWHRVVVWGRQGEACAQYLKKGHAVFVEGMVRSRQYDGKDGVHRISYEIQADRVSFLTSSRSSKPNPLGDELPSSSISEELTH
jgi:single-strand DNA-binding protein